MSSVKKIKRRLEEDVSASFSRPREYTKMEEELLIYHEVGTSERNKNLQLDDKLPENKSDGRLHNKLFEFPISVDLNYLDLFKSKVPTEIYLRDQCMMEFGDKNWTEVNFRKNSNSDLSVKCCETKTVPNEKVVWTLDQIFGNSSSNNCTTSNNSSRSDIYTSSISCAGSDSYISHNSSTKSDDISFYSTSSSNSRSDTDLKRSKMKMPCKIKQGNLVFVSLFQIPDPNTDFLKKLISQRVALETLVIEGNVMKGIIQTMESFKYVHIRYTLDKWKTSKDHPADCVLDDSSDGFPDKFVWEVDLPKKSQGVELIFYVRCETDKYDLFCDKNNDRCYTVKCMYLLESHC